MDKLTAKDYLQRTPEDIIVNQKADYLKGLFSFLNIPVDDELEKAIGRPLMCSRCSGSSDCDEAKKHPHNMKTILKKLKNVSKEKLNEAAAKQTNISLGS